MQPSWIRRVTARPTENPLGCWVLFPSTWPFVAPTGASSAKGSRLLPPRPPGVSEVKFREADQLQTKRVLRIDSDFD